MSKTLQLIFYALAGALVALPAAASDPASMGDLGAAIRAQAGAELQACAQSQGIELGGDTTFISQEESTMVFMPVAGIEAMKREQLTEWTVIGMFTAQGPPDAEVQSGTVTVQVKVDKMSTNAEVRFLDEAGNVVQEVDATLDTDPDAVDPAQTGVDTNAASMPFDPKSLGDAGKHYYFARFRCPWFFPYFAPYTFRYWPGYKHGCYRWYYRWWWGHLHFRYCWWPSRYCVGCRGHW